MSMGVQIKFFFILFILTGIIYPSTVAFFGKILSPLIRDAKLKIDNKTIAHSLIAQRIESSQYFWARPSAIHYNAENSGGSNLSLASQKLKNEIEARRATWNLAHLNTVAPKEMLYASGSGLDPHISVANAMLQGERISEARGIPKEKVAKLIEDNIESAWLGFIGQERVNINLLNYKLMLQEE